MSHTPSASQLRISLAGVMVLVAVAAVLARWPGQSYLTISLLAFAIAYRIGPARHRRAQLSILLGAIYAPCLLGFGTDCAHCRETWLMLFPITPTLAPTFLAIHFLGFGRLPDGVEFCVLLALLSAIARRGRAWRIGSALVGFAWSCLSAWVLHALLRS